jgi:SAM-dependent methyltransferase
MGRSDGLVDPADAWGDHDHATEYERGRPSYPPEVLAHVAGALDLRRGRRVLDVGAGTGKFTRLLTDTGAEVLALEPTAGMRSVLAAALPEVEIVDGTAEGIPLPDESVDALCAATAFHWFDHEAALPEMARVLRAGGAMALVWNERDESEPWVRRLTEIIRWDGYRPYGIKFDWRPTIEHGDRFHMVSRRQFPFVQVLDRRLLVDRVCSISYIATLSEADRQPILAEVADLVADFHEPFELPYLCDVIIARRL